jgi:hypothetical protein
MVLYIYTIKNFKSVFYDQKDRDSIYIFLSNVQYIKIINTIYGIIHLHYIIHLLFSIFSII